MKKRVLLPILLLALIAGACATTGSKTEVGVVTYESVGTALRTAYIYLSEREKNGTLTGDALVKAKNDYRIARAKYLQAGEMMKTAIERPMDFNQASYQALLEEAARIAAA